ncbi:hypothetical protein [Flexivirga sp.]|uniref:hypothetical protein n=1 Tax=Flexivirga sp. TaxID=1962927 RepID=UPI003F7E0781
MSAIQGRQGVTGLVDPPLGGLPFSVSRSLPVLADVVSYLGAAVAALLVRTPLPAPPPDGDAHEPPVRAMRSGLRFAWRHEVLRPDGCCSWLPPCSPRVWSRVRSCRAIRWC